MLLRICIGSLVWLWFLYVGATQDFLERVMPCRTMAEGQFARRAYSVALRLFCDLQGAAVAQIMRWISSEIGMTW